MNDLGWRIGISCVKRFPNCRLGKRHCLLPLNLFHAILSQALRWVVYLNADTLIDTLRWRHNPYEMSSRFFRALLKKIVMPALKVHMAEKTVNKAKLFLHYQLIFLHFTENLYLQNLCFVKSGLQGPVVQKPVTSPWVNANLYIKFFNCFFIKLSMFFHKCFLDQSKSYFVSF